LTQPLAEAVLTASVMPLATVNWLTTAKPPGGEGDKRVFLEAVSFMVA
jgi:hypothetical protein